jgi:hypothetical protein
VSCICFLDNDIIHKLVALNLFYDAIDALQVDRSNMQVLPTARHIFLKQKKNAKHYSDVVWDAVIAVVNGCRPIRVERDVDCLAEIEYLSQFQNEIHVGEQKLILATQSAPDFLLLTGDKVCMRALPQLKAEIYGRLTGRVICFEQVVLLLISRLGFECVKAQVVPMRECDTALRACFGSGDRAEEENVVAALEGYIEDLRREAPGLLADMGRFAWGMRLYNPEQGLGRMEDEWSD